MRREDLKKLFKDVNRDYQTDKFILTFLFFIIPIIYSYSQVKLNNFGAIEEISTSPGYTKFVFHDINKDGIDDILLFGNQRKNFSIHFGLKDSTYGPNINKFFFYPIDDIKYFNKSSDGNDYFIFASRNLRIIGLVSFTKSYSLLLLNTIKFDSYPSKIKIIDMNNDGRNEALIYGNNYNGIVKVENNEYLLHYEKIIEEKIVGDLNFLDFNYDKYPDLVISDILNNQIQFLENVDGYEFIESRKINVTPLIQDFQIFDFNKDTFEDIVISSEGQIDLIYGDSVYTYENITSLKLNTLPENVISSDLNNDEEIELAYTNSIGNEFVWHTSIDSLESHLNYQFDGISYLRAAKIKNSDGIVLLSRKGKLQILYSDNLSGSKLNFTLGFKPKTIAAIENYSDNEKVIFVNNFENNSYSFIKLTENNFNESGELTFFSDYESISFSDSMKSLVAYNSNKKTLEIMPKFNRIEKNSEKHFYYSAAPILRLSVINDTINILESADTNLYMERVIYEGERYLQDTLVFIDSVFSIGTVNGNSIHYTQKNDSSISVKSFKDGDSKIIYEFHLGDFNPKYEEFVHSVNSNDIAYLTFGDDNSFLGLINTNGFSEYKIKNSLEINSNRFLTIINEYPVLFEYDKGSKILYKYILDDTENDIESIIVIDDIELNDYFITEINNSIYLVYLNENNNYISFKKIK